METNFLAQISPRKERPETPPELENCNDPGSVTTYFREVVAYLGVNVPFKTRKEIEEGLLTCAHRRKSLNKVVKKIEELLCTNH